MTQTDALDLLDLVSAPAGQLGRDEIGVTTSHGDAIAALATRAGVPAAEVWRKAWALTLARLGGVGRVRVGGAVIDVPKLGELVAWLKTSTDASSDADAALVWDVQGPGSATARFDTARIDRANAARLGELLVTVIAGMAAPDARLETLSPLSPAERGRVVETWNQTEAHYRPEATVHALVRERAAAHPERTALVWDGGKLSYGELDRWSDALAERLIAAGVVADQPVALCLERSIEAVDSEERFAHPWSPYPEMRHRPCHAGDASVKR